MLNFKLKVWLNCRVNNLVMISSRALVLNLFPRDTTMIVSRLKG